MPAPWVPCSDMTGREPNDAELGASAGLGVRTVALREVCALRGGGGDDMVAASGCVWVAKLSGVGSPAKSVRSCARMLKSLDDPLMLAGGVTGQQQSHKRAHSTV